MFTTLIVIIHVVVCVTMILMILLQSGKGADIGAVFGGGSSQTVFGAAGAATFLSKLTIAAAITFMITSIILSYFSGKQRNVTESLMSGETATEGPVVPGPAVPPETEGTAAKGTATGTEGSGAAEGTSAPAERPAPATTPAEGAPSAAQTEGTPAEQTGE